MHNWANAKKPHVFVTNMEPVVELIAGSYEQIAFGYRVYKGQQEWTLKADFTNHAHTASLSAVAANDRFIATGSRDETIQLYDMKNRSEHGVLHHHNGTISCLEFYGTSHLLSGGEDGLICVWSTKKWECLKSIKAHKGHVSSLSVHPSGKLALSVGTDKTLRTWNLVNGRSAFVRNVKQNAHIVLWSPAGDKYVVVINDKVDIYNLDTATVTGTISNSKRVSSIKFLSSSDLAVAGDDEFVRIFDTDSTKCVFEFKAHETRVKALESFALEDFCVLASASNDGFIKLWKLDLDQMSNAPVLLGEVNTTARLNCLAIWQPSSQQETAVKQEAQTAASQDSTQAAAQPIKRKNVKLSAEEVVIEQPSCPKKVKIMSDKKKMQKNK
ncbi:p21-activated protein kinase-interacting protein 1 [Arapaima gigas]